MFGAIMSTAFFLFMIRGVTLAIDQIAPGLFDSLFSCNNSLIDAIKMLIHVYALVFVILFIAAVITFAIFPGIANLVCCIIGLAIYMDIQALINDADTNSIYYVAISIPVIAGFLFAGKIRK